MYSKIPFCFSFFDHFAGCARLLLLRKELV